MASQFPQARFTAGELSVALVVVSIVAVLALVGSEALLKLNRPLHSTASRILAMSAAIEAYKADNGVYPQGPVTNALDPSSMAPAIYDPANYKASSVFLWQQLSGHLKDINPTLPPTGTNYAGKIFDDSLLEGTMTGSRVTAVVFIKDPFGKSFGYGTAGLAARQVNSAAAAKNPDAALRLAGYNPTFDLWSTSGKTRQTGVAGAANDVKNFWVKNW